MNGTVPGLRRTTPARILKFALSVLAISTAVRFLPVVRTYSADPAQYAGPSAYFINRIVKTGRVYSPWTRDFPSSYVDGINGVAQDPGQRIAMAIVSIIADASYYSWGMKIALSIILTSFFMLLGVALLRRVPSNRIPMSRYVTVLALGAFGSPLFLNYTALATNAPVGWLFIGSITLCLSRLQNRKIRAIALILMVFIPFIYYTPSLILALFLAFLTATSFAVKEIQMPIRMLVAYGVIWTVYVLYQVEARIAGLAVLVLSLPERVVYIANGGFFGGGSSSAITPYIGGTTSLYSVLLIAIVGSLVATPVVFILLNSRRILLKRDPQLRPEAVWAYFVPPLSILFFIWLGLYALDRMQEWGTVAAILCAPFAITRLPKRHQKIIVGFLLLSTAVTTASYITSGNRPSQHLTPEESEASDWLELHTETDQGIFTDLRLSAPLIAEGQTHVRGIQSSGGHVKQMIRLLEAIYYGNDSQQTRAAIKHNITFQDGTRPSIYFMSRQMTDDIPGIKGYDYILKPAPIGFLDKHDRAQDGRIYTNSQSVVYYTDVEDGSQVS